MYFVLKSCCVLDTSPRTLSPYPAVTAVMRNPVYTAWSHCVKTTNSPSVPAHTHSPVRYTHAHPHTHTHSHVHRHTFL